MSVSCTVCLCVFLTLCTNSSILSMAWWACSSGVIPMKPSSLFLSSSSSSSSSFSSPSLPLSSSSFILRSSSHSGTLWQEKIQTLLGVRDFRWLVDLCHLGHFVSFRKKELFFKQKNKQTVKTKHFTFFVAFWFLLDEWSVTGRWRGDL